MKQTAVEWLKNELNERCDIIGNESSITDIFEQAKEMAKQQIIKAAASAYEDMFGTDGTEYGKRYYDKLTLEL